MIDEVCQITMLGEPCGRKTYKDKKECIFHLENKSDEEAKRFEIEFSEELERLEKDNEINGLDFSYFKFPKTISFSENIFEKNVYFIGAQFKELVDFTNTKFNKNAIFTVSQFNNNAIFVDAQFNNQTFFIKAQFNNQTDFSGAQFKELTIFADAQFNNNVFFRKAQFNNRTDFSGAQFNNRTFFVKAQFNNQTYFSGAQFKELADFGDVRFNNEINFDRTRFNKNAEFLNSKFKNAVFFNNAKFPSSGEDLISFENAKFYKPKDVRFQNIDLSNVSFLNTDLTEVEFLDAIWARKNGRLVVIDETRIGKNVSITYGAVAQLYRRLRRNYETNYRFAEAGKFFIGEMEMCRHDVNTNIRNEKVRKIVLWFKRNVSFLGLYKHLSLYGESYAHPIVWTFIVIVSYPMLMHWLFNASLPQSDNFLYSYLRTSAASFFQMENTFIGERLIGFLLLGLLFIALKRQFERKK